MSDHKENHYAVARLVLLVSLLERSGNWQHIKLVLSLLEELAPDDVAGEYHREAAEFLARFESCWVRMPCYTEHPTC